jgi:PAS domain S-box-containing protein
MSKRGGVPRSVDVLTAGLAMGAIGTAMATGATRSGPTWVFVPLLAVLIVGGLLALHFEYRGHVEALDLFEAALMPVILIAPGVGAVVLAALAKGVSQRLLRVPGVKASFNVAQWSAAAATASFVFVESGGETSRGGTQMAVLAVAMSAGIVVNHLAVTAVLALVQQQTLRQVIGGLESVILIGWLLGGCINISFGVLFASVALSTPVLVPLTLVPLAVLHWAQRGYAEARADRTRIEALHRATRVLTTPVEAGSAIGAFLDAVRASFESTAVDLVLLDDIDQQLHHSGDVETTALSTEIISGLGTGARAARAVSGDGSHIGELLAENDRRACLYAPLRQGPDVRGWLLSYDRAGFEGFEAGEASIFEALASELAGALERAELVRALMRERAHLFDVVDRSSDAIFTITADGAVDTWNPAMSGVTGYAAEELGGNGLAQLRPRDRDGAEVMFDRWGDHGGDGLPGDVEILTRAGERRWLECSYATTGSSPASLVVVARDVTRQREVDRLKDDFVATVSHELHTPLTSIMGFTNLLLDDSMPGDRQAEALTMIRKGTRRLSRLISNLLEVSIVEAEGVTSRGHPLDVNEACANVLAELRDTWPKREINFTPGSGAVMAIGNELSIEQILSNLVGNALKYAPLSAVHIKVEEHPDRLLIRVVDDGPGIPPEHLERIFDRFERLDHNHVQAGTGLGLYISRQLARAMNGQLTVESEPGHGATFTLDLPAEVHLVAVG